MRTIEIIAAAFESTGARYPDLRKTWIDASIKAGSVLPNSALMSAIQRIGELDILIRCIEDDFLPDHTNEKGKLIFSFNYQVMFSELWIGSTYEIIRLLKERGLGPMGEEFKTLAHDLRLLRIPLEKYEIAADQKLTEPLHFVRQPRRDDGSDEFIYDKSNPRRSHIMPSGVSDRGSVVWHVIDITADQSYWIERRALSDRVLELWQPRSNQVI